MFKKMVAAALSFALVFSLSGCSKSGTDDTQKTQIWNVASIQTEDHPTTKALVKMGEVFSELTDGRYQFEIYPNELLGPQRETLEQVQYGIIEMAMVGNSNVSSFVDGFLTFEIPFLFDDLEHQARFFATSDIIDDLFKQTEEYNFKIATFMTAGTRNMYSNKPIRNLSDLKGMKIRTAESDTYAKMMRLLGGSATPMSFGEVFTAIQSGVVDGAENNEASYRNSKHYEIAPYYSYTKHLIVPDFVIVNTDVYYSLSEEDRAAFDEAARIAAEYEAELWNEDTELAREEVVANGAILVEDVDTDALQAAVQPLHEELTQNPEIKVVYDAVMATSAKNMDTEADTTINE